MALPWSRLALSPRGLTVGDSREEIGEEIGEDTSPVPPEMPESCFCRCPIELITAGESREEIGEETGEEIGEESWEEIGEEIGEDITPVPLEMLESCFCRCPIELNRVEITMSCR